MLVKSCINFIIIGITLLSVPILIYSIKRKNKSILILDIMYIVYLIISTVMLPNIFGLNQGLENLFTYLMSFIAGIIYIVSIIVCQKNIKKNNNISTKSNKINFVIHILIILPILLFSYSFLRECYLIKNSDLIIETNYQNGMVISETSWYAISENFCKEVTINLSALQTNNKNIEYYTYYADLKNDLSDIYELKSYIDPELKHIDVQIAKKILLDAINNHSNLNKKYSNFDYIINTASITYFENSGYYYVSIGYDRDGNGGMSVINELIYLNDKYIGELLMHGDIKSVNYIEK